ncbi:hypothetical protein KGF86_06375 [Ornithinibacillus massiliensis]|uniref:Uncharacterized protein n=1 Tax=Ornithinibacillus massiliensis TaxID=1944633 RepID=A0ABS5MBZ2_9BACI|nr:hypothetical protein [Ornithinibacillus massiliensis]MBS3679834.1 hypothetical protein [Ornithinibacillus massiliensis]
MSDNYSYRKFRSLIMWILIITILILFVFLLAERGKYANEKDKLESATMYLYNLEVESSIRSLLLYLGLRPAVEIEWEEQEVRETLNYYFANLDRGIDNINDPILEGIPEKVHTELLTLQETIKSFQQSIQSQETIDDTTKEEIMKLSSSIHRCNVEEHNRSWEQIFSEIECLNLNTISAEK